jgi:hypothetical protein
VRGSTCCCGIDGTAVNIEAPALGLPLKVLVKDLLHGGIVCQARHDHRALGRQLPRRVHNCGALVSQEGGLVLGPVAHKERAALLLGEGEEVR